MKIKFKKILPILGLLSIGVAAPIISTACSSTSENPNTDQNKPGQDGTGGDNTGQDGEGNNQQQPTEIKFDKTSVENIRNSFKDLNNAQYGDLSQIIDRTNNNQVEQENIKPFVEKVLGLTGNDDKFEKITISLEETIKAPKPGVSLFNGGGSTVTPEAVKEYNAKIVMTLKNGYIWDTKDLQDISFTVTNDKKELTLKDIPTKVVKDEIIIDSAKQTNLEEKIKTELKKLTDKTDTTKLLEVAKGIKEALNSWNPTQSLQQEPSPSTNDKVVSKVLIELVEANASQPKTGSSSGSETKTYEKAHVIIIFGENVEVKLDSNVAGGGVGAKTTNNSKFELYNKFNPAIKTTQPIDTGIEISATNPGTRTR